MYWLICRLLNQYSLCCLKFPYLPVDILCARSLLFMLFDSSIHTGWYALLGQYWLWCFIFAYISVDVHCITSVLFVLFHISLYILLYANLLISIDCALWYFHVYLLICTLLVMYSICCLTFPYATFAKIGVDMHSVGSVLFVLFDICYVQFDMNCVWSILFVLFDISLYTVRYALC